MILAAGMAAGCTETTKVGPDSYEAPLFLQPSDSKIVFDKEGGKALVTMATYSGRFIRPSILMDATPMRRSSSSSPARQLSLRLSG